MNSMKSQKDRTLKDELPRLVGAQYATGDQWRNNSRKNEETEPKQKLHQLWMWLVMEVKFNAGIELNWPGEGNGNPLQYFCLENPREGGA